MMTEIYFNKELSDISFEIEALDEWKDICSTLGMENQLELAKGKATPIPYPYMNEVMLRVYETLCPSKHEFKAFKSVPIPLEVLRQISYSIKENHFEKIEIWADDKKPDPVVIGHHGYWEEYQYSDTSNKTLVNMKFTSKDEVVEAGGARPQFTIEGKYLIARFGDELKPFDTLKKLAVERVIDDQGTELKREIAIATEKLNILKENATSYINGVISLYDVRGRW